MDKLVYIRPLRSSLFPQRSLDLEKSGGLKVFPKTKQIAQELCNERRDSRNKIRDWAKRRTRQRLFHAPLPDPIIQE